MPPLAAAFTNQKLCIDFASLKKACPKGVYVAPVPDEPLAWSGVVFVRKGPYANAVLRFRLDFPEQYPVKPPIVKILSDVFHPLVTPLTTYTYSTLDTGAETVSATDTDRLPPGGLNLRHGFPEWYQGPRDSAGHKDMRNAQSGSTQNIETSRLQCPFGEKQPPLTVEVLQYLRIVLDTEDILDQVPLEAAANTGAWHAYQSYRAKVLGSRASPASSVPSVVSDTAGERAASPRQQPGGARRPGEWNWQGVWEDRVKKSVQASISEHTVYSGDNNDAIYFSKTEPESLHNTVPV